MSTITIIMFIILFNPFITITILIISLINHLIIILSLFYFFDWNVFRWLIEYSFFECCISWNIFTRILSSWNCNLISSLLWSTNSWFPSRSMSCSHYNYKYLLNMNMYYYVSLIVILVLPVYNCSTLVLLDNLNILNSHSHFINHLS